MHRVGISQRTIAKAANVARTTVRRVLIRQAEEVRAGNREGDRRIREALREAGQAGVELGLELQPSDCRRYEAVRLAKRQKPYIENGPGLD